MKKISLILIMIFISQLVFADHHRHNHRGRRTVEAAIVTSAIVGGIIASNCYREYGEVYQYNHRYVPGHYEVRIERIWVPEVRKRVYVIADCNYRNIDRYYETVIIPGYYENRQIQV